MVCFRHYLFFFGASLPVSCALPEPAAEIQAKIDAQAAVVRDLKEEQGLGNSDPEVKAAVTELLRLKALLEE